MARQKCQKLKDVAVAISRAIEGIPEINGQEITVLDGGTISLKIDNRPCKIKFSMENAPRGSKAKIDSIIDGMLD
jgi:hypothetical protein